MKKPKLEQKELKSLEEVVKKTFCNKRSVVGCGYHKEIWCPNTCGFYVNKINKTKYWNRWNVNTKENIVRVISMVELNIVVERKFVAPVTTG